MKISESQLRKIIRHQIQNIFEEVKPKAGSETSSAEGTIDIKKLSDVLGVDPGKLKTAVSNLRAGKRNSADDKVFGDMVAKLIDASEQDTVKAMSVLKKVESDKNSK